MSDRCPTLGEKKIYYMTQTTTKTKQNYNPTCAKPAKVVFRNNRRLSLSYNNSVALDLRLINNIKKSDKKH